mgnify:CR=1 FL=1
MKVDLIDYMGSDLTVANAARVSFDKQSEWEVTGYETQLVADRAYAEYPINKLKNALGAFVLKILGLLQFTNL